MDTRKIFCFRMTMLLLLSIFLVACGTSTKTTEVIPSTLAPSSTSAPPTSTLTLSPVPSTSTPAPTQTESTSSISEIADDISLDVGQVMVAVDGDGDQMIFVFEETHDSRIGQIEIAIMLNRLHESFGLRQIGLEGAFFDNGTIDTSWFCRALPFNIFDPIQAREDVIVQLLERGEISGAEMMALVYEKIGVVGIEDQAQYNANVFPELEYDPIVTYLIGIAITGMTENEMGEAVALIDAEEYEEAREYILGTDTFTDEINKLTNDQSIIIQADEWVELIDSIAAKAIEVGAEVEVEDKAALNEYREFFVRASERSKTMTDIILGLTNSRSEPVAMIIGAAHTKEVESYLEESGASYAVLRANSLSEQNEIGELSAEEYDRKMLGLSVDASGRLGSLLDSRSDKKPPSVLSELWFQAKAEIYHTMTVAARAIAQGKTMNDLESLLPETKIISFQPLSMDGNELIVEIKTVDNNNNPITIYGRVVVDKERSSDEIKQLDERLFEGKENLETEPDDSSVERISSDTIAKFSTDLEAIEASRLGG